VEEPPEVETVDSEVHEPEIEPEPEIEIVEDYDSQTELEEVKNKVRVYCLPALPIKDDIYDEVHDIKYGQQFLFEAVVVSQNDFAIMFWTNIDMINKHSIIFPQNRQKRWWKVLRKEEKGPGFLYTATPSDIQPDFS
jgi:hypothetical protein